MNPMSSDTLTLRDAALVLRRQGRLIALVGILVLGLAGLYLTLAAPLYTAEALVFVDPAQKNLLNPDDNRSLNGTSENARFESEVEILRSDAVAVATIAETGLSSDPEFGARLGLASRLRRAIGLGYGRAPDPDSLFQATLLQFKAATKIRRRGLTFVVGVSVTSADPARAALLANALARTYIDLQLDAKINAALSARDLMAGQLFTAQTALADHEAAVAAYIENNLSRLEDESASAEFGRIGRDLETTKAAIEQSQLIQSKAQAALARSDWSALSSVLGDEALEALEVQRRELERQLGQADAQSSSASDLNARLEALDAEIEAGGRMALSGVAQHIFDLESDADAARESLRSELLSAPLSPETLSDLYGLQREATLAQDYYDTLLRRIRDAEAQALLQVADSRLVSEALPPPGPSYPDRKMTLALALVAAIGLGVGFAFLNEFYVGGVASASQLANLVPAPVAAVIPNVQEGTGAFSLADRIVTAPMSHYSESFRLLRAAIDEILPQVPGEGRIIMVTSAIAAEGKSTNALALARTYSLAGKRTLLIDADLRKPSQHLLLGLEPRSGLLDYLRSPAEFEITGEFYDADPRSPLGIIMGNRRSDIPTDQPLMSETFVRLLNDARKILDVIIIDTAPLLPIVDPRYVAPHVDLAVLSVRGNATNQSSLRQAHDQLARSLRRQGRILTVINSVGTDGPKSRYDGYYGDTSKG